MTTQIDTEKILRRSLDSPNESRSADHGAWVVGPDEVTIIDFSGDMARWLG